MRKARAVLCHALLALSLCCALFGAASCAKKGVARSGVSVGVNRSIKSAPVILADSLGLFNAEGLDVSVGVEGSAVALMDGLYSGAYDLVSVPEFQAVAHSFERRDYRIVAVLNRNQSRSMVLDGRSVDRAAGLAGKRVGLAENSAAEYTLYRVLLFNGIDERSVSVEYYKPADLPQALANGEVDAIVAWEPFSSEAARALNGDAVIEDAHYGRDMYWLLVTRLDVIEKKPEALSRFLLSLDRAITGLNGNTDASLRLVANELSLSEESLHAEWKSYIFYLELPQSLLLAMEQEARWYADFLERTIDVPDYLGLIDQSIMTRSLPKRVSIVSAGEIDAP